MKIEKNTLKVVQISTGSVLEPSHVGTFTPYMADKESRTFYIGSRLTKEGLPPQNAANFYWADEIRWDRDGDPRGKVAAFDAEREERAKQVRLRIQRLQEELEGAKLELHAIYAGPKPEPR